MENQIWPDAYGAVKCLHRGAWGEVFAAKRLSDGLPVVLKVFGTTRDGNEHARREFDAMRQCEHPGIPKALTLDLSCERPCLVVEQLSGVPLKAWVETNGPPPISVLLDLAITWAEILSAVHSTRLVHRDVTPNNLLVAPKTHETHLIDFGITAQLGTAALGAAPEHAGSGWAGTLQYIAPEQTGRMNRSFSFSSDLYGLGGTIYYALTGQPPFLFDDPLELIHAHIARHPLPPSALRPEIPDALSRLVLKLLAKEPEERYVSALSLRSDLVVLRDRFQATGDMDPDFELEAIEVPDRPRYPAMLYGREREREALWYSLQQAITSRPRVVLVDGPAGSGKSALIGSLRSRLGDVGAYMAQGSFDPGQEWPYSGWVNLFQSFAEQILVESDARLSQWREELCRGLGPIAGVLGELASDMGTVLGDVAPVPPLAPRETRSRLLLAVQRFISAAATQEHPLVLVLDDFQHSDSGSQYLLRELFTSEVAGSFLVIVSCQTASDAPFELLDSVRSRLEGLDVPVDPIHLEALPSQALVEFLENTFSKPRNVVAPLADHIERKTGGNPLWVRQILDHMYAQGLVRFEPGRGWHWELERIAEATVPEGAIGLLIAKLEGLAPEAQDTLSWASCASQPFGAELLERLGNREARSIQSSLLELESIGLVLPCPEGFRFTHDRVREAARARLSEEERSVLHAEVACWWLERLGDERRAEYAFEIADHLVLAGGYLPRELTLKRIELCALAGREALRAGASVEALRYLDTARREFAAALWETQHALGLSIWLGNAESAIQLGNPQTALELLEDLEPRVVTKLERAQLEMHRIAALIMLEPAQVVVEHALRVLRRLGVRWPLHPSHLRTALTMRLHHRRILQRAQLGTQAPSAGALSPDRMAVLLIINAVGGAMSRTDVNLTALATCFVLSEPMPANMGMREAYSAGNFALWLQCVLGDAKGSAELAACASSWLRNTGDTIYAPRLDVTLSGSLFPMHMRRRRALAPLDAATRQLSENGDLEFAYYGRFLRSLYGILAGDAVALSHSGLSELIDDVYKRGARYPDPELCLGAYRWVSDTSLSLDSLDSAIDECLERFSGKGTLSDSSDVWESTVWTMVLCIHGRYERLMQISNAAMDSLLRRTPYAHVPHHILYRGIAEAALGARSRAHRRGFRRSLRALSRWASIGPDFMHMLLLLRAEKARLAGQLTDAHRFYEQASREALSQEFVHHAALAKERRAGLLFEGRRATEGREALRQALQLYQRWGSEPKVQCLEQEHAELL